MIKQVRLIGCQSWEDTTLNFSTEKLNVICADNNTGKSVFYKMLKVLGCPKYFSRDEMKDLIRWGSECATMYLLFDDLSIGMVSVQPTRIVYGYREPGQQEFYTSSEPFSVVLKKAGIISDVRGKFIANIIDTDQDMLLVDSDLGSNYDLMKLLVFNDDLNAVRDRSEALLAQFKTVQMQLEVKDQKVVSMLNAIEYVDTGKLERSLEKQRYSYDALYKMIDAYHRCEVALDFFKVKVNYDEMLSICGVLLGLESVVPHTLSSIGNPVSEDAETALAALEVLESVDIPQVIEGQSEFPEFALMALEVLESISIPQVVVGRAESLEFAVVVLDALEGADLGLLARQFERARNAAEMAERLRSDFVNSGTEYDCPIYGEVVFDGEKCVPYR